MCIAFTSVADKYHQETLTTTILFVVLLLVVVVVVVFIAAVVVERMPIVGSISCSNSTCNYYNIIMAEEVVLEVAVVEVALLLA